MKNGSRFFLEFSVDKDNDEEYVRGRSANMLEKRNDKIFHRYYYYSRILQYKYESVLAALVQEFDLAVYSLIKIISKNAARVKEIGDKRMTRAQLKKKFPHYNWSDKVVVTEVPKRKVYDRY